MIIIFDLNMENILLSSLIDSYISENKWNPKMTDDENIDNIIECCGCYDDEYDEMYASIINIIETKIRNGIYSCYDA